MKFKNPRTLLTAVLMVTALFFVSCGDDDSGKKGPNCTQLESQIADLTDDYYSAYFNEECEELEGLYNDLVDKYEAAKNCQAFKDFLEDEELTYDEYMDSLEEEYDDLVDSCGAD